MQDKVLKTLEYDKIAEMLKANTVTCGGHELAEAMCPKGNFEDVKSALALTAEAESMFIRMGRSPVDAFPDMRECLKRIHAALFVSPGELMGIGKCLRAARFAKESIQREEGHVLLNNLAEYMSTHRSVEEEIDRCILGEEEIFDGASPELARIRRAMRQTNERVRERLGSMIRSAAYSKYLQEPLITIRNGRFVIPVKQEYRQNVPGLIHDQSGSGATLFIEPSAVVELGNEYKKLMGQEQEEIERILAELTALIAPYSGDILENIRIMGELDLAFAKAKLAKDMRAVEPKLNNSGYIRIVQGRHPLIPKETVRPIDIWLGKDFRTLIITGPNTGGKTVTLKTVGLFTLMAESGMFIPADIGSEISVFDSVYADIGDEQSIEQSLSTFSSHMTNIVGILDRADDRSLVLLDELGAGTDPVEGAALAMSILEELHSRNTVTVATTHYSEVKAFALTRDGVENASMEFDVDKLCPTYRLFIGIPGRSNAFEISRRLGISESIIESARGYLKGEDVRFEDVISSAQSSYQLAEEERAMAKEARRELDRLRAETEAERKKLSQDKAKLQAKAREDARRIVDETRREMDRLVADIRKLRTVDQRAADRVIQQSRDSLRKRENDLAEPMILPTEDNTKPPKTVHPGDTVRIVSLDKKATVLSAPDAKGEVQVQAGVMKVNVKLSDLRMAKDDAPRKGAGKIRLEKDRQIGMELDIRGMLVDDAILVVDRYIDNAAISGLSEINIIHGKGTGALRAGIQDYLRTNKRIKSFRLGNYGEGDAGVTVATLKPLK